MQQLVDFFRFTAITHLLVILWLFWKGRHHQKGMGVCILFALSIAGYLLVDWQPLQSIPALNISLLVLPFLAPPAFWLFSKLLFDDGYRWRRKWVWLLAGVVAVYYLAFFQRKLHFLPTPNNLDLMFGLSIQLVSLVFILLGILEAARNRDADLVPGRLQFRTVFIIAAALLMAITALTEVSLNGAAPPPLLELLQKTAIAGLTVLFAMNRLTFKPGFLPLKDETVVSSTHASKETEVDDHLLDQLADFMENKKTWRTEGLTIRLLAEKMGVKEYRLRQAINRHLGYRNFNDFLNGYRIREACALLSNPAKRDLTILEIAYDLGYASLAPFNKAFKEMTGMTPTEWRRKSSKAD